MMASNLTDQVRNVAQVTTAVANGDLSKKITVDAKGEILALKNTINTMVDQLNSFAAEVTRVAREVGTDGKLGGQAEVAGVSGTLARTHRERDYMASNLTDQVRNIAQVATAGREGRPDAEDHGRRQGRDPPAEEHDHTMVRPALELRGRGHPSGEGGGHGGQARRPGPGRGRERDVARPDGERQPARVDADDSAPRDRRGVHRCDAGRPDAVDHRRGPRRGRGPERTTSTR